MTNPQTGYGESYDMPGAHGGAYAGALPVPYVRSSLGTRFFAYLLDIVFIFGFSAVLATLIAIIGVFTLGLGWALFPILGASGILYSAITVGGRKQSTWGMRLLGLRVTAPESGARVDWLTAGVHALLFYVAISTLVIWCIDIAFGLLRSDRRLGHDLLLGLAVVKA